jgi:hypothetical protein
MLYISFIAAFMPKFEDSKGVIRSCISKDLPCNEPKDKGKILIYKNNLKIHKR